jgi:hypothetical protein
LTKHSTSAHRHRDRQFKEGAVAVDRVLPSQSYSLTARSIRGCHRGVVGEVELDHDRGPADGIDPFGGLLGAGGSDVADDDPARSRASRIAEAAPSRAAAAGYGGEKRPRMFVSFDRSRAAAA